MKKKYEEIEPFEFKTTKKKEWIEARKPYAVLFEITSKCNFNCIHCYLQDFHDEKELEYSEIIKLMDILYDKGILFLTLTGGEVLTRKDFKDIYLYAKRKGFLVEIFTNAYLLNDELIELFQQYPPTLVDISIYGSCENTYQEITGVKNSFFKVRENCKKLKEAGVRTCLKSPILKYDENEIELMSELAKEIGFPIAFSFDLSPTIDGNKKTKAHRVSYRLSLKNEFDDYYRQVREDVLMPQEERKLEKEKLAMCDKVYSCNVGKNSFVIDYKGNMLPCMKMRKHGVLLNENNFDDIWKSFSVYQEKKASGFYKCKGCDSRYYCDVCPAEIESLYGNEEYRSTEMCKLAKLRKAFYEKESSYREVLELSDEIK